MNRALAFLPLAAGLAAGCGPGDLTGAEQLAVLSYTSWEYGLTTQPLAGLATPEQLLAGQSEQVQILVGAQPALAAEDETLRWVDGEPPQLAFHRTGDLLVPSDGDSLELGSFLAHARTAADFYRARGMAADEDLEGLTAYFEPYVGTLSNLRLFTDNAAYDPTNNAFILLESSFADGVAPIANLGVVVHEFGHLVIRNARLASAPDALPCSDPELASSLNCRVLSVAEEGWSDFWAAAASMDAGFLEHSFSVMGLERDVSVGRSARADQISALTSEAEAPLPILPAVFDPHPLGAVLASALWRAADDLGSAHSGIERISQLAYRAAATSWQLDDVSGPGRGLPALLDHMLDQADVREYDALCEAFEQPFALVWTAVEGCK